MVMGNNRAKGNAAETIAAEYLTENGYNILERNYYIRNAEIDIIAENGRYIIFIEVKSRSSLKHGMPSESVTKAKQKSISTAALTYLQKIGKLDYAVRFDVIEILKIDTAYHINHIKQAFDFIM